MPKTKTAPTKPKCMLAIELEDFKETTHIEFCALKLLAALGYNTTARQVAVRGRLLRLRMQGHKLRKIPRPSRTARTR